MSEIENILQLSSISIECTICGKSKNSSRNTCTCDNLKIEKHKKKRINKYISRYSCKVSCFSLSFIFKDV